MSKKEIVFVLDRSGSMSNLINETIDGFNSMIENYRRDKDNDYTISLFIFDNHYETVFKRKPLKEITELTKDIYFARGMTALIDAACFAIDEIGRDLDDLNENEKPDEVIFVITTDGAENSSKEFTKGTLKEKITQQEKVYSWEFIFLGANIDTFGDASEYGVSLSNTVDYNFNSRGVTALYSAVANTTSISRQVREETKLQDVYDKELEEGEDANS